MFVGRTARRAVSILLLGALLQPALARAQDAKPEDIYKTTVPSVVTLHVETKRGTGATGTAFMAIKEGFAVTAWHVVRDAKSVSAKFSNGEEFDVSGLVDKDEKRDVAIIRVKVHGKQLLPMVSEDPPVGSKAYVIGAPKGLEFTISDGLISQIQNFEGLKQYQFSCPASPGNSGGPLVNAKGSVIGIVSWQFKDGQNLNFAVPASYALALDASLPTQPWDAVHSTEPPAGTVAPGSGDKPNSGNRLSNDEADRAIAEAVICDMDAITAVMFTESEVIGKNNGYENGVPTVLYTQQMLVQASINRLATAMPSDPNRIQIFSYLLRSLNHKREVIELVVGSIKTAQITRGWEKEANDLITKARATSKAKGPTASEQQQISVPFKEVAKSSVFRDAMTPDGMYFFPDKSDGNPNFIFGARTWLRNPSVIALVFKRSLAEKLGFQTGDVLTSIDGQQKATMLTLKRAMSDNVGKNLLVVVRRGGKSKDLKLHIPSELPLPPKE